jgi:hypothetical protein
MVHPCLRYLFLALTRKICTGEALTRYSVNQRSPSGTSFVIMSFSSNPGHDPNFPESLRGRRDVGCKVSAVVYVSPLVSQMFSGEIGKK